MGWDSIPCTACYCTTAWLHNHMAPKCILPQMATSIQGGGKWHLVSYTILVFWSISGIWWRGGSRRNISFVSQLIKSGDVPCCSGLVMVVSATGTAFSVSRGAQPGRSLAVLECPACWLAFCKAVVLQFIFCVYRCSTALYSVLLHNNCCFAWRVALWLLCALISYNTQCYPYSIIFS